MIESGCKTEFGLNSNGVLCFKGHVCVPKDLDLRLSILQEAHSSLYAMHTSGNMMYHSLRKLYWWLKLKQEVTIFMSHCLTFQKVKVEHQLPSRLLQPVKIPKWKWK